MNAPLSRARTTTRARALISPTGIEIWHVEDYTVPLVSMEFAFVGGAAQDPEGRAGLANLMAGTLDEGAGALDSASFQERLEEKAIELSFDAGRDRIDGSLRTLSEHVDAAFELLALAVNQPRFDQGAIDRVRGQIISGLRREESDPGALARDRLNALAFAGHSYGRPADGRIAELQAITHQEIVAQHKALFGRDVLHIAVVGAISPEKLGLLIETAFGSLPAHANVREIPDVTVGGAGHHELVPLDIPQSTLYLAMPGIARKDPDYTPALLVNHILGGGSFTSRLWTEVREKRGLAYSVWSSLSNRHHAATFLAGTATSNERVAESLSIILAEIVRMAESGPTEEELAKTKAFLIGSYALRFDTSRKIANQLLEIAIEKLGIDYIDRRNDEVAAVTLPQMQAVAGRLFAGKAPLVVAAGQPKGL
jgi:zinc protease